MYPYLDELKERLEALGFLPFKFEGRKVRYYKWVNFGWEGTTRQELYVVVDAYPTDEFLNVWVDKLWDRDVLSREAMGNGFVHISIRSKHQLYWFLSVVVAATGGW